MNQNFDKREYSTISSHLPECLIRIDMIGELVVSALPFTQKVLNSTLV